MEKGVYIISVKQTQDIWLPKNELQDYKPLFKVLQSRLGACKIITSPICECLQLASLMATESNPSLFILDELSPIESPGYMLGVPSSLQHVILDSLSIPNFSSDASFPLLISYIKSLSNNSIVVLQDTLNHYFQDFAELRKDYNRLSVFRLQFFNPPECVIKKIEKFQYIRILHIENHGQAALFNVNLVLKENNQIIGSIAEIKEKVLVKLVISEESNKFQIKLNEELGFRITDKVNLFGSHVFLEQNGTKISNLFYIPEFEVETALLEDEWLCRIRNNSNNKYDIIEFWSAELSTIIDWSNIPRKEYTLLKIPNSKLIGGPEFYVKHQEKIISNVYKYIFDDIEKLTD